METINVVLTGQLFAGIDFETAVERIAALTRLDRSKVERLLNSGQPTVVKKGVSPEVGEQYRAALSAIGVVVELQAGPTEPDQSRLEPEQDANAAEEEEGQAPPPPSTPAAPGPEPSSAPAALALKSEAGGSNQGSAAADSDGSDGNGTASPRNLNPAAIRVPASHGWLWIKNCTDLYLAEPRRWTGMMLLLGLLMIALSMIPVLGSLLSTVAGPVFAGGLMLGAHAQQEGRALHVGSIFEGFGRPRNQLLCLGAFNLLFGLAIGLILLICILVVFKGQVAGKDAAVLVEHFPALALIGLLAVSLTVPMTMAFWFAPCLVVLAGNSAWESLKTSFRALLNNWSAFLVYSLILLAMILVVSFLYGLVAGFLNLFFGANPSQLVIRILLLVLASPTIALFTLSCYTAYRDIFPPDRLLD